MLITPSPVRRLADAAATAPRGIADGLDDVARALHAVAGGDPDGPAAARLESQLHLLAQDVEALTDPPRTQPVG